MPKNKNNPNKIQDKIQERDYDKEVWLRLGVTVFLPEKLQNFKNSEEFESALFKALKNGNYKIEGNSYIPNMDQYVEKFTFEKGDWEKCWEYDFYCKHVRDA